MNAIFKYNGNVLDQRFERWVYWQQMFSIGCRPE